MTSDVGNLKSAIIDRKYYISNKQYSLLEMYIYNKPEYKKLVKENTIPPVVVRCFDACGERFVRIFEIVRIEYFRYMKCEEICDEYVTKILDEKTTKKEKIINKEKNDHRNKSKNKQVQASPEKENNRKDRLVVRRALKQINSWKKKKWIYENVGVNTIKFKPAGINDISLSVTTINSKKSYILQYKSDSVSGERCKAIEDAILSRHPHEKGINIAVVYHDKEELKAKRAIRAEKNKQREIKEKERNKRIKEINQQMKRIALENKKQEEELQKKKVEEENRKLNEKIKKNQEELSALPQINYKDFLVRKATFKCMHDAHHTDDIEATVSVITRNGDIRLVKINAGYCKECGIYFILDSMFERLKFFGVPICRISDEKTYVKANYLNGVKLAQESLLMQYGYNVSKTDELSETTRHKILAVLVDNNIMRKNDIISYLDFFISQRKNQSKFELAISKWENDREFVSEYRRGEYSTYGVNGIYG